MARQGPDVRSATTAKAASQVIVGCGYLTDVIISLSTGSAGKDKAPLRFDSGKRAVETKLLKLVLFIVDGIGTISCRAWMHKVRV